MNALIIIVMLLLVTSICLNIALYKKLVKVENTKAEEIIAKIEERSLGAEELKESINVIQSQIWGEFKKI